MAASKAHSGSGSGRVLPVAIPALCAMLLLAAAGFLLDQNQKKAIPRTRPRGLAIRPLLKTKTSPKLPAN